MSANDQSNRRINIALVHGTWARSAPWTLESSLLHQTLQQIDSDQVNIRRIDWSGLNREKDRSLAAVQAKLVLDESTCDLGILIGHSHGGNVGAQAIHNKEFDVNNRPKRALITLNTPFLIPTSRSMQVVAFHFILLFIGLVLLADNLLIPYVVHDFMRNIISPFVTVLGIFVVFLLAPISYLTVFRRSKRPIWFGRFFAKQHIDHGTRVLCITSADDEALGWLQFFESLLNLPFLLLHRIALPVVLIAIVLGHYFMEWEFARSALSLTYQNLAWIASDIEPSFWEFLDSYGRLDGGSDELIERLSKHLWENGDGWLIGSTLVVSAGIYFVKFWVILAVVGIFGSYILGAFAFGMGFGLESLAFAFIRRLRVSPVPTDFRNVELIEVDPVDSGWLRHSNAYGDYDVANRIAEWIDSVCEKSISK